jgi:hypothetical protein
MHAAVLAAARRLDPAGVALLRAALQPVARSAWPDIAWRFSGLTADGCPVEFAFSTHDNIFRVTIEPAPPECPERDRLDAALTLLETMGLPMPTAERVCDWRAIQSGAELRWGCWLGLRVTSAGPWPKLYVELPPTYPVPVPGVRARMLGYSPLDDRSELYVTVLQPSEGRLRCLLSTLAPEAQDRLLETLAAIVGVPLRIALDWLGVVASFAGEPPAVALFCRARAVRGGPAALRQRLAVQPGYSAMLADWPDANLPDHGVLTFMPRADGSIELRAGISGAALNQR